ncbi:MAG: hypothetical protein EHM55_17750 [Acidobacteria bacterium]|nr:MAG: hypothetical protein EHM55_17750 [Acidobacteriota bacterium]
MTFSHFVRRAHLYMGLFLLPWVIMFGVSSIPLNHVASQVPPTWTQVAEHRFAAALPGAGENLRPLGREMMNAAGVDGGYFVNRANPQQVNVNHPHFLAPVRIIYYADESRLTVEHRSFSTRQFITGLHFRGGYDMGGFWDSVWALFVDIVSVALLLWIATGVYMWWKLPSTRRWGWLALASGGMCFAVIIARL